MSIFLYLSSMVGRTSRLQHHFSICRISGPPFASQELFGRYHPSNIVGGYTGEDCCIIPCTLSVMTSYWALITYKKCMGMELKAKQHQMAQLAREIRDKLRKLGTPMSSQIPALCALSTSLRVGAVINWRTRLEAPISSVLRTLISKCVKVSALLTMVQSPW